MNSNNDQEENSKQQLDNQSENLKEQLETNTIENLDVIIYNWTFFIQFRHLRKATSLVLNQGLDQKICFR